MTKKKTKSASEQKPVVSAAVDRDVFEAIQREAVENFSNMSEVVNLRLGAIYRGSIIPAFPVTPAMVARDRKSEIENELLELKLGIERREYVKVKSALALVARDYANIKSRLNNIPASLLGATLEQVDDLKKIVQDCLTDLSAEKKESWDDLD